METTTTTPNPPTPLPCAPCGAPPPPYLTPLLCPTRHALSLLLSLTLTLALHPSLLTLLLYWTTHSLRLLHPPTHSALPLPSVLTNPPNGARSRYWATLHTLRWEVRRNRRAVCAVLWAYAVFFVMLAWLPREAGESVVGAVWPFLAAVAEVYLHLLVSCTAVRVGVWGVRVALWFAGWAVVQGVREVVLLWAGVVWEYWQLLFAGVVCWASVCLVQGVDFGEVWKGTVGWFLLAAAGYFFHVGDAIRDMAQWWQPVVSY